jgi:hypothetical protein
MSTVCLKCGYSVTEPVCASCVINEIKVWLNEQPVNKEVIRKINNEFKELLSQVESLDYVLLPSQTPWNFSIMQCNQCKKDMHLRCFYCVTNQASQIIKDNLRNESLIESFNESFNTDFYDYEIGNENNSMMNLTH